MRVEVLFSYDPFQLSKQTKVREGVRRVTDWMDSESFQIFDRFPGSIGDDVVCEASIARLNDNLSQSWEQYRCRNRQQ
jgi:hypothetical protein